METRARDADEGLRDGGLRDYGKVANLGLATA